MRQKKSKGSAQMRPDGKRKSCAAKKNFLHELTAARMRPDSQKKIAALRGCDRTAQKDFCVPWHFCAEATGQQKKILLRGLTFLRGGDRTAKENFAARADTAERMRPVSPKKISAHLTLTLLLGCDRTTPKKDSAWPDAAARLKKILRDWKKLQRRDLRGQACADRAALTGQRPVQPVFHAGSTGFGQDGPGKIWLKAAELKFSSKVQLISSSWTRKFSWPSQLSYKWIFFKKILALKFIRILTFPLSFERSTQSFKTINQK
jgi:hypothetical protein